MQKEFEDFLLNFEAVELRKDEPKKILIFEVNFSKLATYWEKRLEQDLGEFERETGEKILQKIDNSEDEKAIFSIIHDGSSPLQVEMKTGRQLAKLLRDNNESVVPSKLMNEKDWNLIIGFGQVPKEDVFDFLRLSYRLITEE